MKASISIDEKKDFIRWFLNKHQMKTREAMWVLNYIAGHDQIVKYVHFVDNLEGCARGLSLSAHGVKSEPFLFFKGNIMTSDPEKAFHDIRLNWDEELYVELHFEEAMSSPEYALVREDNPFAAVKLADEEKEMADALIYQSVHQFSREKVLQQIDEALDTRDEAAFHKLVRILQQMDTEKE
ncbi:YpiB family protein [Listeria monocytogenes]|nr:YpiB family protein [Listeria monocytogenes]EAC6849002.1 YpiB family protein [Listeria monocytogenes]EAG0266376.1 YpiB family protein [Listeria monocytogenes]EGK8852768.1 YpiB family protein [Listeria monocytogenes]EGP3582307.1 YpiB family protein [Listeria monocytogenes]